jgi:hypothetical protein
MAQYTLVSTPSGENITVLLDGTLSAIDEQHPNFTAIKDSLVHGRSDDKVRRLLDVEADIDARFRNVTDRVRVANRQVTFDGEPVDNSLTQAILRFSRTGLNLKPLVAFFANISLNPVKHSRDQLFDWLRDREFTITDDGHFLAYKGVSEDNKSIHSGVAFVNGERHRGRIPNPVGAVLTMPRENVNHDPSNGCSTGLHVATYEFAQGWGSKLLLVKVNPADVVSVPTDADAQKIRVSRYEVVKEVDSPFGGAVYQDDEGDAWDDLDDEGYGVPDHEEGITGRFEVPSSRQGEFYEVVEWDDGGSYSCECPDYRYRHHDCKHIKAVQAAPEFYRVY